MEAIGRLVDPALGAEPYAALGSAFAVSDEWVLTAFHCVGDLDSGEVEHASVVLQLPDGEVRASYHDGDVGLDVALLRLATPLPAGLQPVPLGDQVGVDERYRALGYPAAITGAIGFAASGTVTRPDARLVGGAPALQLYCEQAAAELSLHGLSGGPVLVDGPWRAVGVVRWNQPRPDREELGVGATFYATPLAPVLGRWPQLRSLVVFRDEIRRLLRPAYEPLPPPERRPLSVLLRPEYGIVPFSGRDDELADLRAWFADPDGSPVRLLTGAAGTGKTRLATHLAHELAGTGALVGFLIRDADSKAITQLAGFARPILVVIDYAETRGGLPALLHQLAIRPVDTVAGLRVLLLARQTGDWWDLLLTHSKETAQELVGVRQDELTQVSDVDAELARALDAFADVLHQPLPAPPQLPTGQTWTYLTVHLASLLAVDASAQLAQRDTLSQASLVLDLLQRESRYWHHAAVRAGLDDDARLLARLVAVVSLIGAADEEDAAELLSRIPDLRDSPSRERYRFARWLHDLYPILQPDRDWLGGLAPDLLAETHITATLTPKLAAHVLGGGLEEPRVERALTILDRAARHQQAAADLLKSVLAADLPSLGPAAVTVGIQTGDPIGQLLADVIDHARNQPERFRHLLDCIPASTVALGETAASLTRRLLDQARSEGNSVQTAGLLNALGTQLTHLGRTEEALAMVEDAVTLYRSLAAGDDALHSSLAGALQNLSNAHAGLGHDQLALAAAEEAITIWRQLVVAEPDAHLPRLASALQVLSNAHADRGQARPALAAIEEAVDVYGRLAAEDAVGYLPILAGALITLSNAWADLGRAGQASEAIELAVAGFRVLAADRPDAYLPELAMALTNLGMRLAEFHRPEPALAAIEEGVALYRQLAAARPDAYLPNVAGALNTLSNRLADLGHDRPALAAIEEAVTIFRQLAIDRPDAYLPELAMALTNLSSRLAVLGRAEPALATAEEAVTVSRRVAAVRPGAFRSDLARAISRLGGQLAAIGRLEPGLAAIEEATDIYRQLAADHPDAHRAGLAVALTNLSRVLAALGRLELALATIEEATDVYRHLAVDYPDAYRAALAVALTDISGLLAELGRVEPALAAIEEATDTYRQLAAARPDPYRLELAMALNSLSLILSRIGRTDEATTVAAESVVLQVLSTFSQDNSSEPDDGGRSPDIPTD